VIAHAGSLNGAKRINEMQAAVRASASSTCLRHAIGASSSDR